MDEMVILCAIMVIGPFFFFIIMVCSLKIFGYLNIDLFKPDASSSETEASSRQRPSRFNGEIIDDADLNEQYAFTDRWTTGLSTAANLPIHIAMTELPLPTFVRSSNSQISSQVPPSNTSHSRPQIGDQSSGSCAAANPVNTTEISIPMYHDIPLEDIVSPPPDYNHARLLLQVQAEQHEIPPPTYNECMKMKMEKIYSPKT